MLRSMLRSKIHRATVTAKSLQYEGSITIDADLIRAADLVPNEQVQVLNLNNGNRFETYVIEGEAGSGEIMLNGPAARLGEVGDKVVIVAYAYLDEADVARHEPMIVQVDSRNKPIAK
jgi:aspartate 1-decarboxylase